MSQRDYRRRPTLHLHVQVQFACLIAVVGVAAIGCSSAATPGAPVAAATVHQTCKQQYQAWKTGPAYTAAKTVLADVAKLQADARNEDIPLMDADLQQTGKDARGAQAYPMPACADPAGYWKQVLALVQAAGDNAGSASGLAGLLAAMAPLEQLPGTEAKLSAELARTAGVELPAAVASPVPTVPTLAPATFAPPSPLPTFAMETPAPLPSLSPLPTVPLQSPAS